MDTKYVSHLSLLETLMTCRYVASGSERAVFQMPNGNILKIPGYLCGYCIEIQKAFGEEIEDKDNDGWHSGIREEDRFSWFSLRLPFIYNYNDIDFDADRCDIRYSWYLEQSLREAIAAEVAEGSPILVPMLGYGYTDRGLFFSVFAPMEKDGREYEDNEFAWNYPEGPMHYAAALAGLDWGAIKSEMERLENDFGLHLGDVLTNERNWGFYQGRMVICDYGYATEYNRPLSIAG